VLRWPRRGTGVRAEDHCRLGAGRQRMVFSCFQVPATRSKQGDPCRRWPRRFGAIDAGGVSEDLAWGSPFFVGRRPIVDVGGVRVQEVNHVGATPTGTSSSPCRRRGQSAAHVARVDVTHKLALGPVKRDGDP